MSIICIIHIVTKILVPIELLSGDNIAYVCTYKDVFRNMTNVAKW